MTLLGGSYAPFLVRTKPQDSDSPPADYPEAALFALKERSFIQIAHISKIPEHEGTALRSSYIPERIPNKDTPLLNQMVFTAREIRDPQISYSSIPRSPFGGKDTGYEHIDFVLPVLKCGQVIGTIVCNIPASNKSFDKKIQEYRLHMNLANRFMNFVVAKFDQGISNDATRPDKMWEEEVKGNGAKDFNQPDLEFLKEFNTTMLELMNVRSANGLGGYYQETATHVTEVGKLVMVFLRTAIRMQLISLAENGVKLVYGIVLAHDIGKIGTPIEVLEPGIPDPDTSYNLDKTLRAIMSGHALDLYKIFSFDEIPLMALIRKISGPHHITQKATGALEGYPDVGIEEIKTSTNEVNLLTRILTICDVYNALTSGRNYQVKQNSISEALLIMAEHFVDKGKIDPGDFRFFLEHVQRTYYHDYDVVERSDEVEINKRLCQKYKDFGLKVTRADGDLLKEVNNMAKSLYRQGRV